MGTPSGCLRHCLGPPVSVTGKVAEPVTLGDAPCGVDTVKRIVPLIVVPECVPLKTMACACDPTCAEPLNVRADGPPLTGVVSLCNVKLVVVDPSTQLPVKDVGVYCSCMPARPVALPCASSMITDPEPALVNTHVEVTTLVVVN